MEIEEVWNQKKLEAFLVRLDGNLGLLIGRRVAFLSVMRAAPVALRYFAERPEANEQVLTALPVFAASSRTGLVSTRQNPENEAKAAAFSADSVARALLAESAARAAAFAADSAAAAASESPAAASAYYAARSAAYSAARAYAESAETPRDPAAYSAAWEMIQRDLTALAADPHGDLPAIWPQNERPDWFTAAWNAARETLEADTPGHWTFWITWFERALAGKDLYPHKLAPILDQFTKEDWLGDPALVNPAFDEILADYQADEAREAVENSRRSAPLNEQTPVELDQIIADLPTGSEASIARTKQAIQSNRIELPATVDAVVGFAELEIKRLQERNHRTADEVEMAKQQIKVLSIVARAMSKIGDAIPIDDTISEQDAAKAEKLGRYVLGLFKAWPRENAPELVDTTYRAALVGALSSFGLLAGFPATQTMMVAGILVGGQKVAKAIATGKSTGGS